MQHVSHQTMVMQFILELSKSLKLDPRQCVRPFFQRMKTADEQYKQGFVDELDAFKDRVQKRAKQKVDEAVKQYEEVRKIEMQSAVFPRLIFRKNDKNVLDQVD